VVNIRLTFYTQLSINELLICEANILSIIILFGEPESKRNSDENEFLFDYIIQQDKTKYLIRFILKETDYQQVFLLT